MACSMSARPISGPGRFDWGDVTAAFDGDDVRLVATASSGTGGLIKHGTGTLVLD